VQSHDGKLQINGKQAGAERNYFLRQACSFFY
jgi:hypothetical protein